MDPEDLRLDGNAAAGILTEIFGVEMTVNWTTCAGCGAHNPVGRLVAYIHGMGAVLRCPICGDAMIRVVHPPGRYVLNLHGVRVVELVEGSGPKGR